MHLTKTPQLFSFTFAILLLTVFDSALIISATTQTPSARQVAQKTFPSVVLLVMQDQKGQPISLGTGFFIKDGLIVTNLHVIEGAVSGYAKLIDQNVQFTLKDVVAQNNHHDLAILSAPGAKIPSLILDDSSKMAVGDTVFVVGNPQGLEGTFSQGIVSGIRHTESGDLFQITAPISPGSSGGPVLNERGQVIGVAAATYKGGQNLNFAIPSTYVSKLLNGLNTPVGVLSSHSLSKHSLVKTEISILNEMGTRNTDGVIGDLFSWDCEYFSCGAYSFSLRNQLGQAVKDIYCLVIFYSSDGSPLDISVVRYEGVIPSGLAKRVKGRVDQSVQEYFANKRGIVTKYDTDSSRIQFRILDFKIIE